MQVGQRSDPCKTRDPQAKAPTLPLDKSAHKVTFI
jgi:hypothetical protein